MDHPELLERTPSVWVSRGAGPAGERVHVSWPTPPPDGDATPDGCCGCSPAGCATPAVLAWASGPATAVSDLLPDLVLLGWKATGERDELAAAGLAPAQHEAGSVHLCPATEVLLQDADGDTWLLDHATVADLVAQGAADALTDGIAHEAATVPHDLTTLTS